MSEQETQTRYIRNRRPNALNLRVGGRHSAETAGQANAARLSIQLGRRGTRSDSLAVSERDFKDGQIQQALRKGHIEEISEDSFVKLAARPEQDDNFRDENEPAIKKRAERDPTTLKIPGGDPASGLRNSETIVPEFQPEGQRYHRQVPVTREQREAVRRIMTPGLEYVEDPKPTDKELAPKRKSRKKNEQSS